MPSLEIVMRITCLIISISMISYWWKLPMWQPDYLDRKKTNFVRLASSVLFFVMFNLILPAGLLFIETMAENDQKREEILIKRFEQCCFEGQSLSANDAWWIFGKDGSIIKKIARQHNKHHKEIWAMVQNENFTITYTPQNSEEKKE